MSAPSDKQHWVESGVGVGREQREVLRVLSG